eukprot:487331_1
MANQMNINMQDQKDGKKAMNKAMKVFNKSWGDNGIAIKNRAYFSRKWHGMVEKAKAYLNHKQKQSALDLDSPLNKVKTQSKIKKKKKLPIINEDISVSYSQMDDMNSIMLLDKRENVIGIHTTDRTTNTRSNDGSS